MSQTEVATALGVTYATVSRWENDQKEPDLATIARLADVLGVTPCYLAFGDEGGGVATRPDGPVELRPPLKFTPPAKRRGKSKGA